MKQLSFVAIKSNAGIIRHFVFFLYEKIVTARDTCPSDDGIQFVELPETLEDRRGFGDARAFRRIKEFGGSPIAVTCKE